MKKEVMIEKLDHFGKGIAWVDNIPVFVGNALPNETVEVDIIKQKKKFMEGNVSKYIQISDNRIQPICPFYEKCGGCDIMHIDYEHQLAFKQNKIKEVMQKFGLDIVIQPILATDLYYYRNKVTLQVKEKIGYYQKQSYDIVPIDKCYIANEKINDIIARLNTLKLKNIEQIMIRSVPDIMIVFKGKNISNTLLDAFKDAKSIYFNDKLMYGKEAIQEEIGQYEYYLSKDSFFQVNPMGMIKLYNQVKQYANLQGNEKVLDLYCGTGTIGIYLSSYCEEVLGIEMNEQAIQDANRNKEINHLSNIQFLCGDAGIVLAGTKFNPDAVIVDPPRSGLQENTIKQLQKLKAKKIIYVSCDVMTLARDLKILQTDYEIDELTPVDMFPNTYHVECVCVLKLR